MGKRYQTSQPNLAFTVWGKTGIEVVRFVAGEYPQAGEPDLEDQVMIQQLETNPDFKVLYYEHGQVPDRFGFTQQRRAEIVASARAILEAQKADGVEPEPQQNDEPSGPTIPTSTEIAQMKKEEVVGLLESFGVKYDPLARVLVLKSQLREWIATKSS